MGKSAEKSLPVTYLLCLLLGLLGAHKFYLGHQAAGVSYLVLTGLACLGSFMDIGFVLAAIVIGLCLLDLFLIPRHVRQANGHFG
ncbi:NINE protein [Citricoccus sp. GCM10030269]|uniref:NINE protein n=1 Tax=Citricoccus sp. GCM10030269 TaxID=3273388 RepID=UPI00361B4F00